MDSRTGELYGGLPAALAAGVPERDVVELRGTKRAIQKVAGRVRWAARDEARRRKARRKAQRESRKRNRR